jgi:hypothetical protein
MSHKQPMRANLTAIVSLLALSSTVPAPSIGLVNGDFESPRLTTRGVAYDTTPADFGWTLGWGQVEIYNFWTVPASGQQCLDLNGWIPGGIYQDFTVPSDGLYEIRFAMSANPDTSEMKTLRLTLTPSSRTPIYNNVFSMNPAGRTWTNLRWEEKSTGALEAQAGITYRLEIDSVSAGGASGAIIDDVRLVPIPEPSTSMLLLGGALALTHMGISRRAVGSANR